MENIKVSRDIRPSNPTDVSSEDEVNGSETTDQIFSVNPVIESEIQRLMEEKVV